MKQKKDYKFEIILKLINQRWHVRALAKELGVNHMLIFRKLRELYNENICDFKQEGKNKIYFLKNNLECLKYIFMAENYKFIKLLNISPLLRSILEKIQADKRISFCVLFGSYAKFTSNKNSDIDIYVETEDKKLKRDIELINSKINVKIGNYDGDNLLVKEIEKNHIILKGVEIFYERCNFI